MSQRGRAGIYLAAVVLATVASLGAAHARAGPVLRATGARVVAGSAAPAVWIRGTISGVPRDGATKSNIVVVVDGRHVFRAPGAQVCHADPGTDSALASCDLDVTVAGLQPHTVRAYYTTTGGAQAAMRGATALGDPVVVVATAPANGPNAPPPVAPQGLTSFSIVSNASKPRTGILYEGWHAPPATAMRNVSARGDTPLTVEAVIASNGAHTLPDMLSQYGLEGLADGFSYQAEPSAGFYCIYRKRANESRGHLPDCPNITETLTRHANVLLGAGVDYVTADGTNLQTESVQADVIQVRPMEVLFEEWAALRAKGVATPAIAAWQRCEKGATLWQNILDLYNTPAYADLVLTVDGKQVFFIPVTPDGADPDPGILAQVLSNGGRNNIVVVDMWANLSEEQHRDGVWGFFSECRTPDGTATTSLLGLPNSACDQSVTVGSPLGSAVSASPAFQLNYGSVFGGSPTKLGGRMFKSQFSKVIAAKPDNVYMSSWNEFTAQGQANPYAPAAYAYSFGLSPKDAWRPTLWVDTYGAHVSRDIEASVEGGSVMQDIMASCLRVIALTRAGVVDVPASGLARRRPSAQAAAVLGNNRSDALAQAEAALCGGANVQGEQCCALDPETEDFVTVYAAKATNGSDRLLTANVVELNKIVADGSYAQVCSPWHGPTDVCSSDEKDLNSAAAAQGPFLMYGTGASGRVPLYRCITPAGGHYFTPSATCEGGGTQESVLGYMSSTARSSQSGRALQRCLEVSTGAHYHVLDAECAAGDATEGVYGYVV